MADKNERINNFKSSAIKNIDKFYNDYSNLMDKLNYFLSQIEDNSSDSVDNEENYKNVELLYNKLKLIDNTIKFLRDDNISINELTILFEYFNKNNFDKIYEMIDNIKKDEK